MALEALEYGIRCTRTSVCWRRRQRETDCTMHRGPAAAATATALLWSVSFLLDSLCYPFQSLIEPVRWHKMKEVSNSIPSLSLSPRRGAYPSPVSAQQDCMCHWCFLIEVRSSCLEISAALIESFRSFNARKRVQLIGRPYRQCSIFVVVSRPNPPKTHLLVGVNQ